MAERRLKCALLTYFPYWPGEALLACEGLDIVAFDTAAIGLPEDRNPFGLPVEDRADVALVSAWWHRWLAEQHPDRAGHVMQAIERRADVVVGLDGPDRFALTFPPSVMKQFDVVIKFQGIYRDRELFNYVVGPQYAGANWTSKRRPREERYDSADLDKLRLSVPAYATTLPGVRGRFRARPGATPTGVAANAKRIALSSAEAAADRVLGIAGSRGRPRNVHCLTGLSHVQRIEALRLLECLDGTQGIVATQGRAPDLISGTEYGGATLPPELARELLESARPYWREPLGRAAFLLDIRRHKIAVAPTGYGELTYRHGEALRAGAALVSQDLSHVEILMPLIDRHNVAFCRPDLSDLRVTVDELLADDGAREQIGAVGRRSYMEWAAAWRTLLRDGIEAHIREAVGVAPANQSASLEPR